MEKINKEFILIIFATCLIVVFVAIILHKKSENVIACQASIEVEYNYLLRKSCDPYADEVCKINQKLKSSLDEWYHREIENCK